MKKSAQIFFYVKEKCYISIVIIKTAKQMTNQIQIIEDLFSSYNVDYTTQGNVTDVIITSSDSIDEEAGIIIRLSNTDFYQVSEAVNINDPYMWDEEFVSFEDLVDWIENNYL